MGLGLGTGLGFRDLGFVVKAEGGSEVGDLCLGLRAYAQKTFSFRVVSGGSYYKVISWNALGLRHLGFRAQGFGFGVWGLGRLRILYH